MKIESGINVNIYIICDSKILWREKMNGSNFEDTYEVFL